jgi:hypothetical protein
VKLGFRGRVLIAGILLILLSGCSQVPLSGQNSYGERQLSFYGSHWVGQEFYSSDRNLSRVDVFLNPPKVVQGKTLKNLARKNVVARIYSMPDKKLAATSKIPVTKISRAAMYAFKFGQLTGSRRKHYFLKLQTTGLTKSQAISVDISRSDRYLNGRAFYDGKPLDSDLRFLPFINMNARMVLNSSASRLRVDVDFLIFWIACILATATLTVLAWRRARP